MLAHLKTLIDTMEKQKNPVEILCNIFNGVVNVQVAVDSRLNCKSVNSQVFSIHLYVHLHIDIRCMQIRDGGQMYPLLEKIGLKSRSTFCRKKKMRLNCRSVTFHGSWQSCYSNSLLFFTKCCQSHKKTFFHFSYRRCSSSLNI